MFCFVWLADSSPFALLTLSLCVVFVGRRDRVGAGVCVLVLLPVTSAFTLFRMVPSSPPLSVASKFPECSPQVPPLPSPSVEQEPLSGSLPGKVLS